MSAMSISIVVFVCLFLGAMLGMLLRSALPEKHLSAESKDAVKVGAGLIGTMAALLIGAAVRRLRVPSTQKNDKLTQMASKINFLDRVLAELRPETHESRERLRGCWPE